MGGVAALTPSIAGFGGPAGLLAVFAVLGTLIGAASGAGLLRLLCAPAS